MNYREEERREQNILSISDRNSILPIRLQRLSALPWYDCWVQQLRIEKKSKHTIRAYTLSAKTFSQTSLPGEDERSWDDLSQISVSEIPPEGQSR